MRIFERLRALKIGVWKFVTAAAVLSGEICRLAVRALKTILWPFLTSNASLLAALATLILALLTYRHIDLTRQMAIETRKMAEATKTLADNDIKQFMIRAYPSFLVEVVEVSIENDKLHHEFRIHNKGEITAHNVTFLILLAHEKNRTLYFLAEMGALYKSEDEITAMTSIDHEAKIWREGHRRIVSERPFSQGFGPENLKYAFLFIRFKVPYDPQYRHEVFGYTFKKAPGSLDEYAWQDISRAVTEKVVAKYFKLPTDWDDQMAAFFSDYDMSFVESEN